MLPCLDAYSTNAFCYTTGMNDDHVSRTIAVYDQIAFDYAQKINRYLPMQELEKFMSLLPPNASVLDAGCGPGRDSEYFLTHGLQVTGIDLSAKLLALARRRVPRAKFIQQDLRSIDFPVNSFDGIWACASLHHLRRTDMPEVLSKFFHILKPKGVLFISVKAGTGEEDVVESLSSGLPRHFVYYQEDEKRALLVHAGFSDIDTSTYREDSRRSGRSNLVWLTSFSIKP